MDPRTILHKVMYDDYLCLYFCFSAYYSGNLIFFHVTSFLQECTSSNRRIFSTSCLENGTINVYPLCTSDQAFSSEKLAAQDTDDSDCEVFRVKRRSGIVLEKRCSEDLTINLTENQVLVLL